MFQREDGLGRAFLEKDCIAAECFADAVAFSANARERASGLEKNSKKDFLSCAVLGGTHKE